MVTLRLVPRNACHSDLLPVCSAPCSSVALSEANYKCSDRGREPYIATRPTMQVDRIILDDGAFFIDLNWNYPQASAPGFLVHRIDFGSGHPVGFECIGTFDQMCDGTWSACINTAYDPATDCWNLILASGVARMDAIAVLWMERRSAHCQIR